MPQWQFHLKWLWLNAAGALVVPAILAFRLGPAAMKGFLSATLAPALSAAIAMTLFLLLSGKADARNYRIDDASSLWPWAKIFSAILIFPNILAATVTAGWREYSMYAWLYIPLVACVGINLGNCILYKRNE